MKVCLESKSEEQTRYLGKILGESLPAGSLITLRGDLGVGKTVLAQGLGEGLGIEDSICSPTFTILQIYEEGRVPFYHFDVYRIADPEEMYEVGFEDYFYGSGITLVEWADLIGELLPEERLEITIEKDRDLGFDYRWITLESSDERVDVETIESLFRNFFDKEGE